MFGRGAVRESFLDGQALGNRAPMPFEGLGKSIDLGELVAQRCEARGLIPR
jgi:hypothetical protein